jgi:protein transport protein SEC31
LIATGTKAGAVDADFSNDTTLELWELKLDDAEQGVEMKAVATVDVESRYALNCTYCSWGSTNPPQI